MPARQVSFVSQPTCRPSGTRSSQPVTSFALLPLPHGCSRVSRQRLPCGSASPVTAGIHPQPGLGWACWPPTDRSSQDDLLKEKSVSRGPLTASHFLRSFSLSGCRRHPQAARKPTHKKAGRPKNHPQPPIMGVFPTRKACPDPREPDPVSERKIRC